MAHAASSRPYGHPTTSGRDEPGGGTKALPRRDARKGFRFHLQFSGSVTPTKGVPGVDPVFWGTKKLVDGWLAFVALVIVLAAVLVMARRLGDPRAGETAGGRRP